MDRDYQKNDGCDEGIDDPVNRSVPAGRYFAALRRPELDEVKLGKVANPSSHLSVAGNFAGAILASKVGWNEAAKFFWAVGFAQYLVVFVTLYQRLPTSEAFPKELHPVYSIFIAAPSAASIAWETIYGQFDGLSRTGYFIVLFLYTSLVVWINFFMGFRFSAAWWSYAFPMTTASVATIKYAEQVPTVISKVLALTLSLMSSTMVSMDSNSAWLDCGGSGLWSEFTIVWLHDCNLQMGFWHDGSGCWLADIADLEFVRGSDGETVRYRAGQQGMGS
ncbi:hypothetical protein Ancab_032545 [Ancistrocladus abbreviatus]